MGLRILIFRVGVLSFFVFFEGGRVFMGEGVFSMVGIGWSSLSSDDWTAWVEASLSRSQLPRFGTTVVSTSSEVTCAWQSAGSESLSEGTRNASKELLMDKGISVSLVFGTGFTLAILMFSAPFLTLTHVCCGPVSFVPKSTLACCLLFCWFFVSWSSGRFLLWHRAR